MLQKKRLPGIKVGKSWRIPADAIPTPEGEIAEAVSVTADATPEAVIAMGQPTTQPDAEVEGKVDTDAVKAELEKREEAVKLREEKVTRLIALFEADESELADERRSLDNYKDKLTGWMDDAKERAMAVGDAVVQLNENRYEVQVPIGGNSYKTVTRYRQLERYQVEDLLNRIADGLMAIVNLETPKWIQPREVQEDTEDEFDDTDEQEPDEVDQDAILDQVEQEVDKEVSSEFVQDTAVDVPAIIKPRGSKKQDGD